MDTHDLFRKLTKGVKFKSPKSPRILQNTDKTQENGLTSKAEEWMNSFQKPSKKVPMVSKNPISSENSEDEEDYKSELDDDDETEPAESITLLGSLNSKTENSRNSNSSKRVKKQKLSTEEKEKAQLEEKVNALRNKLRVSVSGGGIPAPLVSFDDLKFRYKVSSSLIKNLADSGYKEPTPIQAQAWPIMLEKRQILACAPTGSGKTAAFLFPILHQLRGIRKDGIKAVIVSPTRELAKQTFRECVRLAEGTGLRIHIISKVSQDVSKIRTLCAHKCDILITTPNRLVYLLNETPPALSLTSVEWLIVDESDKLFEAGPRGFRDQLAAIYQACDSQTVKRGMFSATHGAHVAKWCKENLKGVIAVTVGHRNTTVDQVEQKLVFVGNERGKLLAMREMITKGIQPPVLIFVQSKERSKELLSELLYDGISVDVIHADRTQLQRDNVVRSFREGKIWVLICTELMGRGIDFKGVNLVINYDFPQSAISYIHRIGRTGRAGHTGKAVTFFTEDDAPYLRSIAAVMRESGCEVPEYMLGLKINKGRKKELQSRPPERESISTVPISDLYKEAKLKNKIENAKRKKKGLPPVNLPKIKKGKKRKSSEDKDSGFKGKSKKLKVDSAVEKFKTKKPNKKKNEKTKA